MFTIYYDCIKYMFTIYSDFTRTGGINADMTTLYQTGHIQFALQEL